MQLRREEIWSSLGGFFRKYEYFLALVFLSATAFAIHASALNGFWRYDDGMHLEFATTYAPWQYFFQPSITLLQSWANVTPYNVFFYDVNLALFGLTPRWHYVHLVAILAATAFATYRLMRLWHTPSSALLAAILFLAGLPTMAVAQQLMAGHYATGLLFTVLSLIWFTLAVKQGRYWLAVLGAAVYLLATTCKEVYVPLVVLLPVLPVGCLRDRLKAAAPYLLVAVFYTAWRYAVLGQLIGGYTVQPVSMDERLRQLLGIPLLLGGWIRGSDILAFLLNRSGLYLVAVFVILCAAAAAMSRKRIAWPLVVVSLALLIAPLIPLTANPGVNAPDRYLFVLWWGCAILLSTLLASLKTTGFERALKPLGSVGFIALMLHAQATEFNRIAPQLAMEDTLYRTVLHGANNTALIPPPSRDNYRKLLSGALQATVNLEGKSLAPATVVIDKASLCEYSRQGYAIEEYDAACNCLKNVTENLGGPLSRLLAFQQRATEGIPLSAKLTFRDRRLQWDLGPSADGAYYVVFGSSAERVPANGGIPWARKELLRFMVRHDFPDGTVAVSPNLEFDMTQKTEFSWEGLSTVETPTCTSTNRTR